MTYFPRPPEAQISRRGAVPSGAAAGPGAFTRENADSPAASYAIGGDGTYAYDGFMNLQSLSGEEISALGDYAFVDCIALTTVSFPKAKTIGESAFNGCATLTTASFPQAAVIGVNAFCGCTALARLSIPKTVTIGSRAFDRCTNLVKITIGADCAIDTRAAIRGNFRSVYEAKTGNNKAAGTFNWNADALSWEKE